MTRMAGILLGGLLMAGAPAWAQQGSAPDAQQMKQQIQASFQKDPDLQNNHIDVQVRNGVATLFGNVDSEAERGRAEQLARQNGALKVNDNLRVRAPASQTTPN